MVKDIKSGDLYYASDSGCSCPTPFEGFHYDILGDTDLEPLNKDTLENFKNAVKNHHNYEYSSGNITNQDRMGIIEKVEKYLKDKSL